MKDVSGYEGLYAVTEDGRVWSYPKTWRGGYNLNYIHSHEGKWLTLVGGVYKSVRLKSAGRKSLFKRIHRLVAETFLPNPEGKRHINHKNGNKHDNRVENLEWCTPRENTIHAIATGLRKYPTKKRHFQ